MNISEGINESRISADLILGRLRMKETNTFCT